ncbi:hypothetical protein [Methanoculleus sp.]|uniref:hypothetical protein n=1 Tax=Methanoculleus sp. TaxID=90427 RepID=UPI0025F97C1B|nr:hypothetical protein [Methanoculleus sp.]
MASFDEFLGLYTEEFLPAYSDLVGYLADKPDKVPEQIEAIFSHIMASFTAKAGGEGIVAQQNLDRAYIHLIRLVLDCRKILWALINKNIDQIYKDDLKRKLTTNMPEYEFIEKHHRFKESAIEARRLEMQQIGKDDINVIRKYREACELGLDLLGKCDPDKVQAFDLYHIKNLLKMHGIGLLVGGIIGGVLATIVCRALGI